MHKIIICLFILLSTGLTGCSRLSYSSLGKGDDEGTLIFAGDRTGINEFFKGLNGVITETKSSADVKSAFFQNQDLETQARAQKWILRFGKNSNNDKY